jgi:hypothetical protein
MYGGTGSGGIAAYDLEEDDEGCVGLERCGCGGSAFGLALNPTGLSLDFSGRSGGEYWWWCCLLSAESEELRL